MSIQELAGVITDEFVSLARDLADVREALQQQFNLAHAFDTHTCDAGCERAKTLIEAAPGTATTPGG